MAGRTDAAIQADLRRVRRAALRAGLWVGLAAAVVMMLLGVVVVLALFASSRPDRRPGDGPGGAGGPDGMGGPDRVISLDAAVPIVITAAVLSILILGIIAGLLARRGAAPLAAALAVQRAFVADASHELRTPLTTLSSRIQLAQHRAERGGDVQAALADLRRDAAVMDAVLTDLLLTAEAAGSTAHDSRAVAMVGEVASACMALLEPKAEAAGIRLVVSAPPGLAVAAEPTALHRAFTALVDNALRVAPPGSDVVVTASAAGRMVEVRVIDSGPGIVGLDPARVFDRFARTDAPGGAPADAHRGFGLGLALVRDLAHRFGGEVVVEATSAAGTTFLLSLPRATDERPRG